MILHIHGICKKAIFFSNTTPVTVRTSNSCGDPTDRKFRERKSLTGGFSLISCPPEYAEVGPLMSLWPATKHTLAVPKLSVELEFHIRCAS